MEIRRLNGLDLFSGIGGISLALEPWVIPIAYCEKERFAQAILLSKMQKKQLPIAPIWDDVQTLKGKDLPKIEIVYGGFPCQDISVAGLGRGLEGKRSGLFFEIVRLCKEIKPKFIFLENVPAIRSRGAKAVCKELAKIGYDCRWTVVSASELGAPHKRERWFLLAYANGFGCRGRGSCRRKKSFLQNKFRKYSKTVPKRGRFLLKTSDLGFVLSNPNGRGHRTQIENVRPGRFRSFLSSWWKVEPRVGRVADGIPQRVDRIKGLGNAVVPLQAREAFERLMGLK